MGRFLDSFGRGLVVFAFMGLAVTCFADDPDPPDPLAKCRNYVEGSIVICKNFSCTVTGDCDAPANCRCSN